MTTERQPNNQRYSGTTTGVAAQRQPQKYNPKEALNKMIGAYLESNPIQRQDKKVNEVEMRFGTNTFLSKPISKIDYENVIKKIMSVGFSTSNSTGVLMLRIQNEDATAAATAAAPTTFYQTRCEINGIDLIQHYCSHNSIQQILDLTSTTTAFSPKVKFTMKTPPMDKNGFPIKPVNFNDFSFRVSYQLEEDISPIREPAKTIVEKWTDQRKLFRYINRVRYSHPSLPVFADISIIKSNQTSRNNKTNKKVPVPQKTIQEARVFDNVETYEIEMEIDNGRIGVGTIYDTVPKITQMLFKTVRIILGAIQKTNYPVSYVEQDMIIKNYWRLFNPQAPPARIISRHFIGPSSVTLQLENVSPILDNSTVPNIRKNYTVTDKADGERNLLFVNDDGKIYTIDTNMNVIFTGMKTKKVEFFNSLLDGEHIKQNNKNQTINLFAAFDVYFINNKSLRELPFIKPEEEDNAEGEEPAAADKKKGMKDRLSFLGWIARNIAMTPVVPVSGAAANECQFQLICKMFYQSLPNEPNSIFSGCATILANIRDGQYQYNTDGLIFTPTHTGVGGTKPGETGELIKTTWNLSFKWKPPQYNTIDFLVSIKKDKNNQDEITNIFQPGIEMGENAVAGGKLYKTLVLRCGFDENKHRFVNPYQSILDGNFQTVPNADGTTDNYKPKPFIPTHPYDPEAYLCNIIPFKNENGTLVLKTEDGEYFEEDMIVEFKYDVSKADKWRWVPIRVRYDKTAELRNGIKNYGNAYHVANNNWSSIHFPITETMMTGGEPIPSTDISMEANENVYYKRDATTNPAVAGAGTIGKNTVSMRNFHNLFVKRKLILGVAARGDSLIDYSVGKAGDLSKWVDAQVGFVLGIDISPHNIYISIDSACSRYLKEYPKHKIMPHALFVTGNSSMNIRNGDAFSTEKDKMVVKAVFGNGAKDKTILGKGVYDNYGVGLDGFNISSSQFSIHYFFETASTLHGFVANLSECTKVGGHFIGTCFDGETLFQRLTSKQMGEPYTIAAANGNMICEITKQYDETGFPNDEQSLGYAILVHQETIARAIREYLVNFVYFQRIMENYGFVLETKEECRKMNLPDSTGLFDELYSQMENEQRPYEQIYKNALNMTPEEKTLSFMNRYFVFKKVRKVDTVNMRKQMEKTKRRGDDAAAAATIAKETVQEKNQKMKIKPRKVKGDKLLIAPENYDPDVGETLMPPPPPAAKKTTIRVKKTNPPAAAKVI